jgi:hypothetical protein
VAPWFKTGPGAGYAFFCFRICSARLS